MLADRVQRRFEEVGVVHAGDLDRILERHEHALAGALFRIHREQVLDPRTSTSPAVTS